MPVRERVRVRVRFRFRVGLLDVMVFQRELGRNRCV